MYQLLYFSGIWSRICSGGHLRRQPHHPSCNLTWHVQVQGPRGVGGEGGGWRRWEGGYWERVGGWGEGGRWSHVRTDVAAASKTSEIENRDHNVITLQKGSSKKQAWNKYKSDHYVVNDIDIVDVLISKITFNSPMRFKKIDLNKANLILSCDVISVQMLSPQHMQNVLEVFKGHQTLLGQHRTHLHNCRSLQNRRWAPF